MPFIPHTEQEVGEMLSEIGVDQIEDLFDEIPKNLRNSSLDGIASGMSEMEMLGLMRSRSEKNLPMACFLGAGSYDHFIPSAVWDLSARGEFMTAYTPYQAEASQGTLQVIYEYQTMIANLTSMDVSNASVYDGASGLAEAVLMAVRANKKNSSRTVLMPEAVHPHYREVVENICSPQGIEFLNIPIGEDGRISLDLLEKSGEAAALIIPQMNFFGLLEDVDSLTTWAKSQNTIAIALVNPLALSLLTPPGEWGISGVDIACGDGQPLGIPMASGGPSFGFICCTEKLVRQLPGRLVGRTVDSEGNTGFSLTLQAREQHIRRGKATSNICTNQGLLVTAATIYMSIMGAGGLASAARLSAENSRKLVTGLLDIEGVEEYYDGPYFHERLIRVPGDAEAIRDAMLDFGVLAGLPIAEYFPEMSDALLLCATEKRTENEIRLYIESMRKVLNK
tara:strand:- start:223 stop:1575 length:1353 start_codon:yes stop_codon:yes gene_type:complete